MGLVVDDGVLGAQLSQRAWLAQALRDGVVRPAPDVVREEQVWGVHASDLSDFFNGFG